jgi:hypothetical protein
MTTIMSIRFHCEPIRTRLSDAIGARYAAIGTPLSTAARIIHIQNMTDVALMFSFDAVDDHIALPAGSFILLDLTSNHLYMADYTKVYVKQIGVPTTGGVYVTVISGQQ